MRLAGIAMLALLLLSSCKSTPIRGVEHAVFQAPTPAYPDCRAQENARFTYRKRVLFTRLDVRSPKQLLRGLRNLDSIYPGKLTDGLNRERYLAVDLSSETVHPNGVFDLKGQVLEKTQVITRLARAHRAQFVVGGELIDVGQQNERDQYSRNFRFTPVLSAYAEDPERLIVIRLDVYDGTTGELIDQEFFRAWSKDQADLQRDHTVMGKRFMQTHLGRAINGLLVQQSEYVGALLSCIPLQANVIQVEEFNKGSIAAGASQGLRPGDKMKVYRSIPIKAGNNHTFSQRLIGSFTVTQVYPQHAVGSLSTEGKGTLRAGDWVRKW